MSGPLAAPAGAGGPRSTAAPADEGGALSTSSLADAGASPSTAAPGDGGGSLSTSERAEPVVVLLAHGSPDPRHATGVAVIAERMGVTVAYLQHHGPDLPQAVADAPPGAEIHVLPLLLSQGVHAADDVPELLAAARAARPDLRWEVLATMPPADLLPSVLEALAAAGAPAASTNGSVGAVGVAAGSSKPGALAAFAALTAAGESVGVDLELANGPRAETAEAIARLRERGHAEVWVVPLLFADGILGDIAAETAHTAGAVPTRPVGEFPGCPLALAAWVG